MTTKRQTQQQKTGADAEQKALEFLSKQKLKLLTRNYRCRSGELDLIMQHNDTLVVVEVRYRHSDRFGSALESITPHKQSRIIAATQHYVLQHNINPIIRFDVIAISGDSHIDWIQNAFQSRL
ncbi:YraN family protein [methane-oxidizing endosymbiont of Gigantopelta aegis]|uniref:YraN family protein n=1 Tax=methane-oxidizing endosymbiont of Gigantopelta aegis TaxID=2794938 RepID=UPI0018DEC28A|nr:YraN family protein [methane-oxidizing endosymbiont of Gigantopelta aegis]